MNYSKIKDNHSNGNVGDFLKSIIEPESEVSIVSAYFTIYAYHHLKEKLNSIKNLKFLFGEPTFLKSLDPQNKKTLDFTIEDDRLAVPIETKLTQKNIAMSCAEWFREKAEIRSMVKPNFLHGKLYFVKQSTGVEKAIAGSSNFTVNGLGLGGSKNIELNLVIDSDSERAELKEWFDQIWNDSTGLVQDVKEQVLKYLEQLYTENDPEFIYFKTLFHLFHDYLDEQNNRFFLDKQTGFYDTQIWNALYDFQKDGVRAAINKILKHNGCIIADSVGLGKTYEALAIIKFFNIRRERVLVLCPKKLHQNWSIYESRQNSLLNPFKKDDFKFTLLYHTDMGRETNFSNGVDFKNFEWDSFGLVVIDESHNFRGNPMEKEKDDGTIKLNRAKWLMDKIIKSGVKTKVLMLSATPVNNTLRDIRNQIAFITEDNDTALYESAKIKNISLTLENAQKVFTRWADTKNRKRNQNELLERLDSSFFKLLDEITIARSRKHVVKYYNVESIGKFPERVKPISIYPEIDLNDRFPSYDRINKQILEYKLSVFSPSVYVKPEFKRKYEEQSGTKILSFKQIDRENYLIGMMKVNYLKRLESSIESFEISLERTIKKIENLIEKIKQFNKSNRVAKDEDFSGFMPEDKDLEENGDDIEAWQVGKKLKFNLAHLELDKWMIDLKKDKDALVDLHNNAQSVTPERDAKLKELKELITQKINNRINDSNKKVIVFTAFADTAEYLYKNLKGWIRKELKLHTAIITGSGTDSTYGKKDYDDILINFSPKSKKRNELYPSLISDEIDILFATDCISEGQNLQDCDFLINYDIHWNPVRIIQRFGRIDRLGSSNKTIQLVNFWPTKDLDNYINLKERVEARMALVDVTATGEDNILNTEQIQDLISDELKFRNRQLKKLQNEVLDIEDMEETISLTDFTLDDFRVELLKYIQANRIKLENNPLGLYAIVPSPGGIYRDLAMGREFSETERNIILPGIIFCLKQKDYSDDNGQVNPLNPYFLVYVRNDGTVRYNYTNSKQILEIYKLLCQGITKPYEMLCDIFNNETGTGEKMEKYSGLLKKAANEIAQVVKKKGNIKLITDRSAIIIPKSNQLSSLNDFELITWLVIK